MAALSSANNNAYCQDNAVSYFDWNWSEAQSALHLFVKSVIALRPRQILCCTVVSSFRDAQCQVWPLLTFSG